MVPLTAPWFVALPDTDAAAVVATALRATRPGTSEVAHSSGRPWLLGRWTTTRLATARSADGVIAVIGDHAMTDEQLGRHTRHVRSVDDLHRIHAAVSGSVHLLASVAGTVRLQGTASGLRRVFRCVIGGVPVAGDNALVLASLAGSSILPERVAARLLLPSLPWPLGWNSVWDRIVAVPPSHHVTLSATGAVTEGRWWRPPSPDLSRDEAAQALRSALTEAVRVRITPDRTVVSHLSGLDSSSVCSLAVRSGAEVVAMTAAQPDTMDHDVLWAGRTVEGLRQAGHELAHEIISADECPLVYAGMLDAQDTFDEPFLLLHNRSRFRHILGRGERHRPRVHLMGLGGDEMCTATPQWLPTLLARSPLLGLRRLHRTAKRRCWSYRGTATSLLTGRTYPAWLRSAQRTIDGPGDDGDDRGPRLGWDISPVMPAWATPAARAAVRDQLREAAASAEPLGPGRGTHYNMLLVHTGAQAMRGFRHLAAQDGITVSAPFFDDHVLAAALSCGVAERYDPERYKPVLVDAMRGIVPAPTLARTNKSDTAASAVLGSRAHRDQILGLCEDSALADLGLIDQRAFREACLGPTDIQTASRRIEPTLSCEMWLRNRMEDADVHLGA
ncbi:asparagine synthase-related protein [Actinophytocola sp.]|uniref:asparagine synthase-related protein n=1 Tax=Actinophytocola sp. TaxID=1872138 RepID=UPI00389A8EF1